MKRYRFIAITAIVCLVASATFATAASVVSMTFATTETAPDPNQDVTFSVTLTRDDPTTNLLGLQVKFDVTPSGWRYISATGTDVPAVVLEVQPGDLIAFNHRIKHASFGGGTSRRMFTINLQQRFRDEDQELLRECVASLAGFWYDRVYTPLMVETAGPERMRHLEQRLAHADHLPDLVAKARQKMSEPNRF